MPVDGIGRHVKIERRRKKKSDVGIRNKQIIHAINSDSGSSIEYDEKYEKRRTHCDNGTYENARVYNNVCKLYRHVFEVTTNKVPEYYTV